MNKPRKRRAKINRLAGWAGGKAGLAERIRELMIPGQIPEVLAIPFIGGCSELMAMPRCQYQWVNDANPKVLEVIRALQDAPHIVQQILERREFSREEFEAADRPFARTQPDDITDYRQVADLLTRWWMGPGGIAGTNRKPWFAQRHTKNGGCPKRRWESFRESLPAIAQRFQGVHAYCLDFREFLRHVNDTSNTAIYSDSPYFRKTFKYEVDFTPQDHIDLAEILNGYTKARVVVSYDDAPELVELYPESKWRRVRIEMAKAMSHASGKSVRNTEILLVNDAGWEGTP